VATVAGTGLRPAVSLAHGGGVAVALASLDERAGVGIDVEAVRPLPEGFEEAGLTAAERAALGPLGPAERDEWLLRCWCAKEAAGKAWGAGLNGAHGRPAVTSVDRATGRIEVAGTGRRCSTVTHRDGGHVVATVVWEDHQ